MRKQLLVLAVIAVFGGVASVALGDPVDPPNQPADDNGAHPDPPPSPEPEDPAEGVKQLVPLPCSSAQQEQGFPNYWAGQSFGGLWVSAVIMRCDLPVEEEPVTANYVSYLYGTCEPSDGHGCMAPIEIQTWPAVERNKESLEVSPGVPYPGTDTEVSGVPAAKYDGDTRLEIYHPDVTIVIFGYDPSRIDNFASALVQGPVVLAELAQYGITFTPACLNDPNYCVGEPLGTH